MADNKNSDKRYSQLAVFAIVSTFVLAATMVPRLTAGPGYGPTPNPSPIIMNPQFQSPPRFDPTPPIIVPTDVQPNLQSFQGGITQLTPGYMEAVTQAALAGVMRLPDSAFPQENQLEGPISGITVKFKPGSEYTVENDRIVNLKRGEILVSVKRPSKIALIKMSWGNISVAADGDVLCKYEDGVLRVTNLDGGGQTIKCQLNKGPFSGPADPTVAIAAGFELVAGEKRLSRADMRPKDGVARRHFKVLENGHLGISEISVDSIMKANDVIADLRQQSTGVKERRIIGDMSKMAAILNLKNSTQGFKVEE
ncbi:MAG: hypothetical protein SGJ27_24210 [Candidatus Melainabacteria bacterium]|nr:hypothetical protein [Candidatus Melainabacteria bacterium]